METGDARERQIHERELHLDTTVYTTRYYLHNCGSSAPSTLSNCVQSLRVTMASPPIPLLHELYLHRQPTCTHDCTGLMPLRTWYMASSAVRRSAQDSRRDMAHASTHTSKPVDGWTRLDARAQSRRCSIG